MSIRRGGVCGVKSKACRNLFGPVDHEEVDAYLKKELGKIQEEQNQRWNFDFDTDTPLDGSYEWESISDNVPQFYQARILVSPRCVKSNPDNVTDTRLSTTITNHSTTACGLCDHIRPTQSDLVDENTPSQSDIPLQPSITFTTPKSRGTSKCSRRASATRKTTKLTRVNQIQISADCFRQRKSPKRKLQLCGNDQTTSNNMTSTEKQPRMMEETVQS